MMHYTANFQLAYCDTDTALVDLAAASQDVATKADAALTRGGVAPPNASDLITVAGRVTTLENIGAGPRLARLESAWTAVTTSTSFTQLATAGGAVVAGMQQIIPLIPAGHQAEIEVAVPSLALPASTTVQLILQDATGAVVVLDAAEESIGATGSALAFPLRLSGQITAGATDLTNRTIRTWLVQPNGASSATIKAAAGAPIRQRYRIR
jgi:hypothetical protein